MTLFNPIPHFYSFNQFKKHPIVAGFSDRTYNFTPGVDSEKKKVFLANLSIDIESVFFPRQVHGSNVCIVDSDTERTVFADAVVTGERNLPIGIVTADCFPLFLYDPVKEVVGVVHAGWKGIHAAIIKKTIEAFSEGFDSRPADLRVGIGPGIGSCCFEVKEDVATYFAESVDKREDKLYVDLVKPILAQLHSCGVSSSAIVGSSYCTRCRHDLFFSYREEGVGAGRLASIMMLQ